jgi:hypothetical protein
LLKDLVQCFPLISRQTMQSLRNVAIRFVVWEAGLQALL